jgi:hypothetical protein
MLAIVTDENFREQIVNGLRRRLRGLDLITAREAGLLGSTDPEVLAWAADLGRVVLTQDLRTMKGFAYERVGRGEPMPGVFEVPALLPIGQAIEELLMVIQLYRPPEIENRVVRLPL